MKIGVTGWMAAMAQAEAAALPLIKPHLCRAERACDGRRADGFLV